MDFKKIGKKSSYFFSWLGLNLCSLIIKVIPAEYLYGFAERLAFLGYHLAAKQRKIALESLAVAFGQEKSDAERGKIAQDSFTCMSKSAVELLFLMDRPGLLKRRVELVNRQNLEASLAGGRGVILVSAHFGNFPLMLARLSLQGYKSGGIMRQMKDARVEKIFLIKRNRLGIRTIYSQPRKACVEAALRSLRNNEIVFIPIDQNFGSAGVFVDFFGQKAATATGPIVLAKRTGAAVLPCFIIRQKDDTHKIIFEPAMTLKEGNSGEDAIAVNIQRLTEIIESYIRKYPAQWSWVHRRWKSRPN